MWLEGTYLTNWLLHIVMRQDMDLERIGSRQRDKSMVYAEESEALDQIAKEVHNLIYTHA